MDEREFFDKLAPSWDDNEQLSTPDKVAEILEVIDIKPGEAVLDLGTGTGVLLPEIARRVGADGRITAVDYSEEMLKRAKQKFKDLVPTPEFLNLDLEVETVPGDYDKILFYCVYPHLHTPFDTIKWLKKVNLKKDGGIFIAFPCDENFINNIHKEKHSESDMLPGAEVLASQLREAGIEATVMAATPESYIIKIR